MTITDRSCQRPSFRRRCGFVILCALAVAGCRSNRNERYDLLEAELRTRERELAEARAELTSTRSLNQLYQHRNEAAPAPGNDTRCTALRDITLGVGTGGYDADGQPGDEGLQIILVPKDDDGSAIKVPGRLTIAASEVTREGTKIPVGLWEIPPDKLRVYWSSGILSSGYKIPLQWHRPPTTEKVRVIARLTTTDGRTYETDRDVSVRPIRGAAPAGPLPELPPPAGLRPPG